MSIEIEDKIKHCFSYFAKKVREKSGKYQSVESYEDNNIFLISSLPKMRTPYSVVYFFGDALDQII